jgi:WD40 repeat protein
MTTFERFEREIPELMTELAPASVPEYFDDMLRQTARHRQRPAWSYLERWLPMGVIARTVPMRSLSWRPILILALLSVLIAAGVALYTGSRETRLPPPFGPARNGTIIFSTADGDIVAADPVSGRTRPIVTSPQREEGATFSPDGRRIMFARVGEGIMVANADGSGIRRVLSASDGLSMDMIDWSQRGDRIVGTGSDATGRSTTLLIDPDTGARTTLHLGESFWFIAGRYGTNELVLASEGEVRNKVRRVRYWVVNDDGSGLRQIPASPDAINSFAMAPDGSILVYATWGTGDGRGERIHVTDISTGIDRLATPDPGDGFLWQDAFVSPDSTYIVSHAYTPEATTVSFRLGLIRTDGTGHPRLIGATHEPREGGADVTFSPDGTKLLVTYHDDRSTWLFDVATGDGRQIAIGTADAMAWQRLAP